MSATKEKGIELVRQAIQADNDNNYPAAYELYTLAIKNLEVYAKYDQNPKTVEVVKKRIEEYQLRANQLHKILKGEPIEVPEEIKSDVVVAAHPRQKNNMNDKNEKDVDAMNERMNEIIMTENPNVSWDHVAGLEGAKAALKEAVVLPIEFPHFFTGERKKWSGFLLYGPPGTGKSFLAKAVATEAKSTFFSVSASSIISKYMGESEKMVAQLFATARQKAPSIIFIDEVDSLCGSRGGTGEHESTRRIKTEFLVRMQGVESTENNVLVMAATNLPYHLDQAIRRRFDRRIFIPLPDAYARTKMFQIKIGTTPHSLRSEDFTYFGEQTEGFSGSDIAVMVKDVLFEPIRKLQEATHFLGFRQTNGTGVYFPCSPGAEGAFEATLQTLSTAGYAKMVMPPPITRSDFERVLARARPTVSAADLQVYEDFTREFGEEG